MAGVAGNFTYIDAEIDQTRLPCATAPAASSGTVYFHGYTWLPRSIWETGVTMQGSGKYNLQDAPKGAANVVSQKAYVIFNAYGSVSFTDALSASLSVNNLTDEIVATESEEGTATPGSYVRGRLLTGRTTNLALKYKSRATCWGGSRAAPIRNEYDRTVLWRSKRWHQVRL
jgi:outer membrane receptor protein involved in Fe transport